jgi:2-oxoglutarate dehydrogenase E2 component (dihydrolipoamide succinyltransferase)
MTVDIKIPSPGESIAEVELATWFVANGDFVEKDQEIAELESDKATLTLTAEVSGTIALIANEGETIPVGAVACSIEEGAVGQKSGKAQTNANKEQTIEPDTKDTVLEEKNKTSLSNSIEKEDIDLGKRKISPLAKKHLQEKGISLSEFVQKLNRISRNDIDKILDTSPEFASTIQHEETYERKEERQKMSALRKKLSKRLVQVKNQTAMLTTFNEVDISKVMAVRNEYKQAFFEKFGIKLGFMSFFTKAASIALQYHPNLNAMIDEEEIVQHNYNDIGIAVQTPKGLMVPVVRDVNQLTLAQTEAEIAKLAGKAREAKISLDELSGGTFTITNGGVFGSLLSTPIINPPQSGILGMHTIKERPIAENGQVVIRPMMYIALSYDHRIVDGKDSVGFLVKLKELIENPEQMLFDGKSAVEKLILG